MYTSPYYRIFLIYVARYHRIFSYINNWLFKYFIDWFNKFTLIKYNLTVWCKIKYFVNFKQSCNMVADVCHVVLKRVFGAKTRKGATRKTAKWWLFLVFAWRHFPPPNESTRHSMRCVFGYCLSHICLTGRKVAMRKTAKITIWRVFAWRPFAFSPRKHAVQNDMAQISHHYYLPFIFIQNKCIIKANI